MEYYEIKNLKNFSVRGAYGSTFGDACRALGWDFRDCMLVKIYSYRR